jgi:hypothetical protein
MPLETGDYISDLVETNPPGTDPVSQGDDHLRLIKHVLKTTFPNIDGPVNLTDEELNGLVGAGNQPIFTSYEGVDGSGTHTFDPDTTWYKVIITGAGAGGGDGVASFGGGYGGATCIKSAAVTAPTAAYTVGAGGALNTAGGDSTWDDGTVVLTAGGGPAPGFVPPATATGGDINLAGGGPEHTENENYGAGGGSYWVPGNSKQNGTSYPDSYGVGGAFGYGTGVAATGGNGYIVIEEYK